MIEPNYVFNAVVKKVVDGDTLALEVDLGFQVSTHPKYRLYGLNTKETKGKKAKVEKADGLKATKFVEEWVAKANSEVVIASYDLRQILGSKVWKTEHYGRWLVKVWRRTDGACLNDDLLAAGLAVVDYYGRPPPKVKAR